MNTTWSMDFMSDSMVGGRKFRTYNVMDDCTRETLVIEVDTSLSSDRIIRTLERTIDRHGKPAAIPVDNRPEFDSKDFELLAQEKGTAIQYIHPGRPMPKRLY